MKNITFEEGTEKVAHSVFCRCAGPLEVILPDSVKNIGNSAFYNSGITKIEMANSSNNENGGTIEKYAFGGCKNLVEVKISNAVTTLEVFSFQNCTGLESIEIPKSIATCGDNGSSGAFTGCTNLKNIKFEQGTEKVAPSVFCRCAGPLEVNLPDSVKIIGDGAFNRSGLTKITIPDSLKTISINAFSGCSSLSTVNYRGDATAWSKISIAGGNEAIKNVTPTFNYDD